jgi:L,D-transpeptidase YcbB
MRYLSKPSLLKIGIAFLLLSGSVFFVRKLWAHSGPEAMVGEKLLLAYKERGVDFALGQQLYSPAGVKSFYKYEGYKPCFVNTNFKNFNAGILLGFLDNAEEDGLVLRDYHRDNIRFYINHIQSWLDKQQIDSLTDFDILLSDACLTYASDLSTGQLYGDMMNVKRPENMKSIPFNTLLKNALDSQRLDKCLRNFIPSNCRYLELKASLDDYRILNANGGFVSLPDSIQYLVKGDKGNNAALLRKYLVQTSDLKTGQNDLVYDDKVALAVSRFQKRHGLKETGIMNAATLKQMRVPAEERMAQIIINMERLRWLPPDLGQKYLMVNIADFGLEIVDRFNSVLKMKVIVGTPFKQTPIFHEQMRYVVINPYWDVPISIASEEILPILKRNPGYLSKNHMKLFNQGGTEINPYRINWGRISTNGFNFKIRQVPGTWNSLGAIKFLFPNPYNVYLHGTPNQTLFDKEVRTFSHGCMRVEDPMKLAVYILKNNGWDREKIESQISKKEELYIVLKGIIPVYVTYRTAWMESNGMLCFRNDIYSRDEKLKNYAGLKRLSLNM